MGAGYGGFIPCDATTKEGDVTYFTTAINKYVPVATGGSAAAMHTVVIRTALKDMQPHLPGELPPRLRRALQAQPQVRDGHRVHGPH